MTSHSYSLRRGISLMEVLISIGILAIGLSSVVALVPAGKSEAAKAVVFDRGASLAMNVLNDAVTFGLTRQTSVATAPSANPIVFDGLCAASGSCVWLSPGSGTIAASGTLKPLGVFASSTSPIAPPAAALAMLESWAAGEDDVTYAAATKEEDPPTNLFSGGKRAHQGRMTALVSIRPLNGIFGSGTFAKVSAVVFHNRNRTDLADAIVTGTFNDPSKPVGTVMIGALPEGRTLKEVIRPGTVICSPGTGPGWHQVAMASIDESTPGLVYVTFTGDREPVPGTVQIALDSVGLAERIVVLEGDGPYGQ